MPQENRSPLETGATIGILGGGQLGRMLAIAAAHMGMKTIVYDPSSDCPASQTTNLHMAAAYDDETSLREFARASSAITYEFENIPLETVEIVGVDASVRPGISALQISRDRLVEKEFISGLDISTAPFAPVNSLQMLDEQFSALDSNAVLKTRRFGYDGKGQIVLTSANETASAWEALKPNELILEGFVDFDLEISVIGVRGVDGEFASYDPAWNRHSDGILRISTVPAPISDELAREARSIASKIMQALDYVGVMGVEMFVTKTGDLLVNEIAPRVHNSGHWTESACSISQFENHIRAICGYPIGSCERFANCEMQNLIGDDIDQLDLILAEKHAFLHLYGKSETRAGRKMGHVNRLSPMD
ncbi:MAG: 5-(carboxyamino)imidazole ribonucleotide synthase [Rhizobiaceae bacterium]